jgi:hypothetical protein
MTQLPEQQQLEILKRGQAEGQTRVDLQAQLDACNERLRLLVMEALDAGIKTERIVDVFQIARRTLYAWKDRRDATEQQTDVAHSADTPQKVTRARGRSRHAPPQT